METPANDLTPDEGMDFTRENIELKWVAERAEAVRSVIGEYIIGQHELVELMLTSVFSSGHILLEGVPGVAKTLASKVLSKAMSVDFSRIQFTPDLMPSDVIGTSVFNMNTSTFSFKKGPVFSNIVLIDEINRAPAKTQAALFEVMEERQITYDGEVHQLDFPFLVLATQNPVEQEGTYALPEAQLDRFLFKVKLEYPTFEEEVKLLQRYKNNIQAHDLSKIQPVLSKADMERIHACVEKVVIDDQIVNYVAQLTAKTRAHAKLFLGASPRASLALIRCAKAYAALNGRDFVVPDDIQFLIIHVFNHRLILTPEAEMEGEKTEDVIKDIINTVEVPR